jgi:hypothetical protein
LEHIPAEHESTPDEHELQAILSAVRSRASTCLDIDASQLTARLVARRRRERSTLYFLELDDARSCRTVLVKSGSLEPAGNSTRPQLGIAADADDRHAFEYRALRLAHDHFTKFSNPALWSVFL